MPRERARGGLGYADPMLELDGIPREAVRPLRRAEYDRLVADGVFDGEKIELLAGYLVRMSPSDGEHAEAITRLMEHLVPLLVGRTRVRVQLPFAASDDSEPEPDVALVPLGTYRADHPAAAVLVIEVSNSSLRLDRGLKAEIYARAGVPEYWIVDLKSEAVEVRREPRGGRYTRLETLGLGDVLRPVALPGVEVPVEIALGRG